MCGGTTAKNDADSFDGVLEMFAASGRLETVSRMRKKGTALVKRVR
jgi:hypothetical protein